MAKMVVVEGFFHRKRRIDQSFTNLMVSRRLFELLHDLNPCFGPSGTKHETLNMVQQTIELIDAYLELSPHGARNYSPAESAIVQVATIFGGFLNNPDDSNDLTKNIGAAFISTAQEEERWTGFVRYQLSVPKELIEQWRQMRVVPSIVG